MSRFLSFFIAALGAAIVLLAVLGYLPLRDFAVNGTTTFNPNSHFVLGPASLGLEAALAKSAPSGNLEAAAYCAALERRLIALALVGLTLLVVGIATARKSVDDFRSKEDGTK